MLNQIFSTTCCFRGLPVPYFPYTEEQIKPILDHAIQRAIREGYRCFITGGQRDFETWAAEIVLEYRRTNPEIQLICCLAHPNFGHGWRKSVRERLQAVAAAADETVLIRQKFDFTTYHSQCRWMTERSSLAIVYYECAQSHGVSPFHSVSPFFIPAWGDTVTMWNVLNVLRKDAPPAQYDRLLDQGYIAPELDEEEPADTADK